MYVYFLAYKIDYTDVYHQSFWEDIALEVTMSSVRVQINLQDSSG